MHAIINGQQMDYVHLDATPKGHLLLRDGTRYIFDTIDLAFFDPPDPTNILIEVAYLAHRNEKWMLDTEPFFESIEDIQNSAFVELNDVRARKRLPRVQPLDFASVVMESPQLYFGNQGGRENAIARKVSTHFFDPRYVRRWGLWQLLRNLGGNSAILNEISAVAWFEGNYTPVLFRSFQIVSPAPTNEQTVPPEYFHSFKDAAKYIGVSDRTVKNWKRRNWLIVEQEGRKIRIARSELDKCRRKP